MHVRLTQLDGKLPNLALLKLAAYHRDQGDQPHFTRSRSRQLWESGIDYGRVYGSAIFSFSAAHVAEFQAQWPGAIVGGTWDVSNPITVEQVIGDAPTGYDYETYNDYLRERRLPEFTGSLGFTQRGCRFKCGFCVVPKKEGQPKSVSTIAEIWRGPGFPKHIHLLDNDFFGQPREQWEARINEIVAGKFAVCFNQGINVRMIDDVAAAALASIRYRDDSFSKPRLYTAWDNIGDEKRFFRGIETLDKHGVPPKHVMAYMLVGYDRRETWERIFYRWDRMRDLGIWPYVMVYNPVVNRYKQLPAGSAKYQSLEDGKRTLGDLHRWANRRYQYVSSFFDYRITRDPLNSLPQPELPFDDGPALVPQERRVA